MEQSALLRMLRRRRCPACGGRYARDRDQSKALDAELQGLHRKLFLESNPIPVKWALAEMGRICGGIRLPMTQLSIEHQESLREAMRQAGVIAIRKSIILLVSLMASSCSYVGLDRFFGESDVKDWLKQRHRQRRRYLKAWINQSL